MQNGSDQNLELRLLEPADSVSGFSLGDPSLTPLKTFLRKDAQKFHKNGLGRTWCFTSTSTTTPKVVAYITLVCGEIAVDGNVNAEDITYNYSHFPAVKIARLAVDKRYSGQGLGSQLVNLALAIVKEDVIPNIGCRFIVVDSKKNSVKFYEKKGFTLLDTQANRNRDNPLLFIDLIKIDVA